MTKETPADRLRKRRIELGYEDAATAARQRGFVSDKGGVRTYQAHEAGTKPIGKEALQRYADSYGLTLDYLVSGRTHSNKGSTGTPQPPLSFRYVGLLSLADIVDARDKLACLSVEPRERILVSVDDGLGNTVRAIRMSDDSMTAPVFDPNTNIRKGEDCIMEADAEINPGDTVCAVLHRPKAQITARVYAPLHHFDAATGEQREILRLSARNPLYPEQIISSPANGYIIGKITDVQSKRSLVKG